MVFQSSATSFAPPATKVVARTYLEGDAIVEEARSSAPTMLPETPGFVAAMDATGAWAPVGIALAMTEPNGPVEHAFFVELLNSIERRLRAALPVDAVYICSHGAALTTEEDDPDGVLFAKVREIVGADVPIAATLDLHANVSERMVTSVMPSSAIGRTRISTCASAARRRPLRSVRCSVVSSRSAL